MEIDAGVVWHAIVGVAGILILCGVARIFAWYSRAAIGR